MVSCLLGAPLRYPTLSCGSRSAVQDLILDRIPDRDREFPLFSKGSERIRFEYGVFLLNKNIAQLRWMCGEVTGDGGKATLMNLARLVAACSPAQGQVLPSTPEYRLPEAPPALVLGRKERGERQEMGPEQEVLEVVVVAGKERPEAEDEDEDSEKVESSEEAEEQSSENSPVRSVPENDANVTIKPEKFPELKVDTEIVETSSIETTDVKTLHFEAKNGASSYSGEVEEGVEAEDLFRDIAMRTQALSTPTSFKARSQRYYK